MPIDYPEALVVRYLDEATGKMMFIQQKADLQNYIRQVFAHFKELGVWKKVRIISDEPKNIRLTCSKSRLLN